MSNIKRRTEIWKIIESSPTPIPGNQLSGIFNVSRQVIVQDIALLRAQGFDIIATTQGYTCQMGNQHGIIKTIAVKHDVDNIEKELEIITDHGGSILDIIVEHPIYGEIRGNLMIRSAVELKQFLKDFKLKNAEPLSMVTNGIHLHTIEVPSEKVFNDIKEQLRENKILLKN